MSALTRLRVPIAVLIAVVFAALLAIAAFSSDASARHSWGKYHWARTSNPLQLKLGDNVSSAWDTYLTEAISDWNASTVLDLTKDNGGTNPEDCDPTLGRVEVCNATYGDNGWLGIARIWAYRSSGHIVQGTVQNNDTYFNTTTYNTAPWRRLVMCQEVAHTFGLDHQDERFSNPNLGTCMDYTNDPDGPPSNEHPNQHDYDQVAKIYSHLDGSTTATMPRAASQSNLNEPRAWGRLIRESPEGRLGLYQRDLGADRVVFTFVIWADLEAKHKHEKSQQEQ